MKKSILVVASLMMLVGTAFAAPKAKAAPVEVTPISVQLTEANVAENQGTMQNPVFNADGSVTYDAMMRYGGGAYTFYINGKSGVDLKNYKTIVAEIKFEPKEGWKNNNKYPKFKIVTWGPGATFYNGAMDRAYFDAEELSGEIKFELDISAVSGKAVKIAVPLNAWKWAEEGGSENDLVGMTVKSITLLP